MDVLEAIRTRRSIRKYKTKRITRKKLVSILEAARLAPSAANRQPWRFVVVQKKSRKAALAEAANNQTFLKDADVIVAVVSESGVSARWHEKDTMIATEHMVLAATSLGYGTCWIGAFDEDAVKSLLKIPANMKVVALLPIGVPNEAPRPKPRKKLPEMVFTEEWNAPWR